MANKTNYVDDIWEFNNSMANKTIYVDAIWEFNDLNDMFRCFNSWLNNFSTIRFNKVLIILHEKNKLLPSDIYSFRVLRNYKLNYKRNLDRSVINPDTLYHNNELKSKNIKIKQINCPGYWSVDLQNGELIVNHILE